MRSGNVLAVDLDGTLVRTDLTYESFWSAFGRSWTVPFVAAARLWHGRPALKRRLAELGKVNVGDLPYDAEVLNYIRSWRLEGGRTALVTASDQELATKVADHLGEFDEVYGTTGINLKGSRKAAFLVEKFGEKHFAYVGDSAADLPVWEKASKAITVHAPGALRARVDAVNGNSAHLSAAGVPLSVYVAALRPHQWLKNLLVFVPMLMAHEFTVATIVRSIVAFVSFSLIASAVYLVNDLLDLSADRAHPRKRNRPLASGALPIAHGTFLSPFVFLAGFALAVSIDLAFAGIMAIYFVATIAYSIDLKRRLVIDICALAGLYALRVLAGGLATHISPSVWLLAFSIFFFYSLAAIKRQAELIDSAAAGRIKIQGRSYRPHDVPLMASMAASAGYVSVLVMALYVNSADVLEHYSQPKLLWGICLVLLYWISRMVMVTHRGRMHDDPIVYAARDRISRFCLLLISALVAGATVL